MRHLTKQFIILAITILSFATIAIGKPPVTIWQATFHDVMPNRPNITMTYCLAHSPSQFTSTVSNILSQGAKSKNGVLVKYKNYQQSQHNGLYFIEVNAIFSGITNGKPWSLDAYLHEQKLIELGVTDVVWSNSDCKGKFTGRAINLGH
jgi:hypothetical protein